jgi:hypothetical protein
MPLYIIWRRSPPRSVEMNRRGNTPLIVGKLDVPLMTIRSSSAIL